MCNARTCYHQEGLVHKLGGTNYHRYHIFFLLKNKATQYSLPFVRPSLTSFNAGNSLRQILGIFQYGAPLVTHSQILSTFQDGRRVEFPTLGIAADVKIPTHVHLTKSNSPGLPDPPSWGKPLIGALLPTYVNNNNNNNNNNSLLFI